MRETKRFFDLEEIRSLPIKDVCSAFGIPVERSNFIRLRPEERTASTKLYINKGRGNDNFYDFGASVGGDCINLIERYCGCSWQDALEAIADAFGIQPVNNTEYDQRGALTNLQWERIGVYGDLVTKNLDFDLEKFSVDSAIKYATKYQMSVNELRDSNPGFYIAAILRNRAFPYVYGLRNSYFMEIYSEQSFQKTVVGNSQPELFADVAKKLEESRNTLVAAEKLLKKALRGTDVKFSFRDYNVEKDWEDMSQGKISFEIGNKNNAAVKQAAKKTGVEVLYKSISVDDYYAQDMTLLETVPHAAFLKGNAVTLVYTSKEQEEIDKMFSTANDLTRRQSEHEESNLAEKIEQAEGQKNDLARNDAIDVSR